MDARLQGAHGAGCGTVKDLAIAHKLGWAAPQAHAAYPRSRYDKANVIDALGGPGEFNPDAKATRLTLREAKLDKFSQITII